jgi:hypothetical protein
MPGREMSETARMGLKKCRAAGMDLPVADIHLKTDLRKFLAEYLVVTVGIVEVEALEFAQVGIDLSIRGYPEDID